MGRPKIRSSIRSLFNLRPPGSKTMTWSCTQQSKTESFRDAYKNFNSIYYPSSASSSSSLCIASEEEMGDTRSRNLLSAGDESLTATSSSSLSSDSSCSYPTECVVPKGISPQRFFFSPCATKSLAKEIPESEQQQGLGYERDSPSFVKSHFFYLEDTSEGTALCRKSTTMALSSVDPYTDFRLSMEEMVRAHGIRDWSHLQDLLHCYLRLNEKTTHRVIALAFVDLLMSLLKEDEDGDDSVNVCPSFRLCIDELDS